MNRWLLTCIKTGAFWRFKTQRQYERGALDKGLKDYTIEQN